MLQAFFSVFLSIFLVKCHIELILGDHVFVISLEYPFLSPHFKFKHKLPGVFFWCFKIDKRRNLWNLFYEILYPPEFVWGNQFFTLDLLILWQILLFSVFLLNKMNDQIRAINPETWFAINRSHLCCTVKSSINAFIYSLFFLA